MHAKAEVRQGLPVHGFTPGFSYESIIDLLPQRERRQALAANSHEPAAHARQLIYFGISEFRLTP
ncbi:MAG TPA: hypothetical protein VF957_21010, partial [Bradyrhizobium sp.]